MIRALEIAELRGDGPRPRPARLRRAGRLDRAHASNARSTSAGSRPAPGQQFDDGLIAEAVDLRERYDPDLPAFSAIGYHEAWDVADGRS